MNVSHLSLVIIHLYGWPEFHGAGAAQDKYQAEDEQPGRGVKDE
jgi:hypothetical protein